MGGTNVVVPCLLDDQGGGFYNANPGDLKLVLQNQIGGTTNFVCPTCVVWDVSKTVRTIVTLGVNCSATGFEFKIPPPPPGTTKTYRIQLTFAQVPTPGASADLVEAGCGQVLLTINPARLVVHWQLTVKG